MKYATMSSSLNNAFRQHIRRPSNLMIRRNSTTTSTHYLISTWNDYFQLRSKRRQFEVLSYVPSTILPAAITGAYVTAMDARDKTFYEHIKKNRADARLNSIRNPVPDYYGEKIQSVEDYRSWLRKQREHHRKGVFGGSADDLDG
ncbi:hypothetical protein [Absidia glauca]|uniref:Presequence translocated-associated motor subunit PAM17 n=1 Tax=Absidia glauca TaxID=4829 RepID=A0A168RGJ5_ABSGL|nr:hypothetical protein [Absidia glauca]